MRKKQIPLFTEDMIVYEDNGNESINFFNINLFILLLMAALGLICCTRAFSSYSEHGLLFVAVHGLLIAVASLVAEHGV